MIVIADATPLNYLVLIDEIDVLPKLFGEILIPPAVWSELQDERTPESVRQWIAKLPEWLQVRAPSQPFSNHLIELDPGEREAITLAGELGAELLIMDERKGRRVATQRHFTIVGTLRVLYDAAGKGLVDLPQAFARLQQTTFRSTTELYQSLLASDAQRKK